MKRAVIAFSGGLDSTTLLYSILKKVDQVLPVFVRYGSVHGIKEYEAARKVIQNLPEVELYIVNFPAHVFLGGESALMGEIPMPRKTYEQLSLELGPSPTVVPFRNANIISVCTALAQAREYDFVYLATHATDAHNWAYPDCSPEFMGAMMNAVYVGTYRKVRLITPFTWMTKSQIVALAFELEVPLGRTRSCYEGVYLACGVCPTCVERIEAFRSQGFIDPVPYAKPINWKSCLPWPYGEK